MKDFLQRFDELLKQYSIASEPGITLPARFETVLIRACLSILNEKLLAGFGTPEEDDQFFQAALPFFLSLESFVKRKYGKPRPHWVMESLAGSGEQASIRWTGSKTEAVELIYELTHVGVLNDGRVTISQVTKWFEQVFNIELGNVSKLFQDVRNRKKETASLAGKMDRALIRYIDKLDNEDDNRERGSKRA